MMRSLGLVALMLLGLMFYAHLSTPSHPAPSADAVAVVEAARTVSPFPVLAARSLPQGWYANAASFDAVPGESGRWRFHIGYTDGATRYTGITASNAADASTLLPTPSARVAGQRMHVSGLDFSAYRGDSNPSTQVWVAHGTGRDGAAYVIRIDAGGSAAPAVARAVMAALADAGAVAAS